MTVAQANPSTAQTNAVLAPAVSGSMLRVRSIYVAVDTAMTVTLMNSTTHATEIFEVYLAANSGVALGRDDLGDAFQSLPSEGIDYTTSAAGNAFVKIGYEVT